MMGDTRVNGGDRKSGTRRSGGNLVSDLYEEDGNRNADLVLNNESRNIDKYGQRRRGQAEYTTIDVMRVDK